MFSFFGTLGNALFRWPARDRRVDYVLFGLGNPGADYRGTRHNVGYETIDLLSRSLISPFMCKTGNSLVAFGGLACGRRVALVKPLTFMNRSGEAVVALLRETRLDTAHMLVIVDDFNLNLGVQRMRGGGSDGGHNGLKSIVATSGKGFPRLRIGVGPLIAGTAVIDFVLGRFGEHELKSAEAAVAKAALAAETFVCEGLESAMSRYNG